MNQKFLQLYADFIVKVGVHVRPRQTMILRCPVTMPDFAHACVRSAYEAGAKNVVVRWEDEQLTRLQMELAQEQDLCELKPYELRSYLDYAEDPDGCCTLAIHAADPEAPARGAPPAPHSMAKAVSSIRMGVNSPTPVSAAAPTSAICPM